MTARAATREVSFKTTKKDYALIDVVVGRAISMKLIPASGRQDLEMDITATHCNGCPLDFEKWLAFDNFSFAHDVVGIQRHISRVTGELTGFFLPRCARPSR